MCRRINCKDCGRPSYAGCGMHIESVLGDVPPADRCHCRDEKKADAGKGRSWWSTFLGK